MDRLPKRYKIRVAGSETENSLYTRTIVIRVIRLNTVQWVFDFKQFDWFGGHRLSAHILVIDYIWKTPGNSIYFEINICR